MLRDTIKAAYLEELRFAKRQQWAVTTAVIALIAGAYSIVQPLGPWEKRVAVRLIWIAVAGGWYLLCSLQCHLRNTRLAIDPDDRNPLLRGADVVIGMVIALVVSAGAVCYSLLWRDEAHHLLLRMQGQVW
jgi:hypothetical protein